MSKIEIFQVVNSSVTCTIELIIFIVWRNPLALMLAIVFAILAIGLLIVHLYFRKAEEREAPLAGNLEWVSKGLRKYLKQDKFGVYKEKDTKIPAIYKFEYANHKKHRQYMINYHYARLEKITDLDRIEKEKLLRMG